jgi:hypothetical protein
MSEYEDDFWDVVPYVHPDDGGSKRLSKVRNFYQTTRRNIPEDSHLHTRRREIVKSHHFYYFYM